MKTGRQSALWLAIVLVLAAALMRWRHEPRLTVCGIKPGMRQQQVEAVLGRGWRDSEDTWSYGNCCAVYRGGKVRLVGGNRLELDGRVLPPETKLSDLLKLFGPHTEVKGGRLFPSVNLCVDVWASGKVVRYTLEHLAEAAGP